ANWDMIYLTVAYQLVRLLEQVNNSEQVAQWVTNEINRDVLLEIGKSLTEIEIKLDFAAFLDDFKDSERTKEGLFSHLDYLAKEKLGVEKTVFAGIGELWSTCEHVSQEWYVGDNHVLASTGRPSVQTGKKGFLSAEKVLAPAEEIASLFE